MNREKRCKWLQELNAKFPHHVDLVPPLAGFEESAEEAIIDFLEPVVGRFDMYGEFENGKAFVRYCFRDAQDALNFRDKFGMVAEKMNYKIAS